MMDDQEWIEAVNAEMKKYHEGAEKTRKEAAERVFRIEEALAKYNPWDHFNPEADRIKILGGEDDYVIIIRRMNGDLEYEMVYDSDCCSCSGDFDPAPLLEFLGIWSKEVE